MEKLFTKRLVRLNISQLFPIACLHYSAADDFALGSMYVCMYIPYTYHTCCRDPIHVRLKSLCEHGRATDGTE